MDLAGLQPCESGRSSARPALWACIVYFSEEDPVKFARLEKPPSQRLRICNSTLFHFISFHFKFFMQGKVTEN